MASPVSFRPIRGEFRPRLRLPLPLAFAEIGWMSMGFVDTIMVGRWPNSALAIGATGLGQSLYNSVAIFGGGLLPKGVGLDLCQSRFSRASAHSEFRGGITDA
jgi:MATE family multidrug resistance protein